MIRTHLAKELTESKNVTVAGWVDDVRDLGGVVFITLRDFSGIVQVTAKKTAVEKEIFDSLKKMTKESVIVASGECIKNKNSPGGHEIIPKKIEILSAAEPVLPIDIADNTKTGLDKRLDFRSLDLRRRTNRDIFRIQSTIIQEMNSFFKQNGFVQVFTPCLMGVAAESGSDVFPVFYFNREAFLRQDPQLHRQLSIAGGIEKIFEFGPSWRAEKSHTTRHLTEHRTVAAEVAFIEDEYDIIKLESDLVRFVIDRLKNDCGEELKRFGIEIEMPKKIPVLEFPQIYEILKEIGCQTKFGEEYDTSGEKALGDYVKEKYRSDFFFVNRFPYAIKPFYVMRFDDDPVWARSIDFIFRGIELSSGGQREHRYERIIKQAKEKGISEKNIAWFANFFKYGVPPHGGFSIGIERFTEALLGLQNIREAVLFPRDVERLVP
jgi:aspartyl-tRNA synthetase